MMRGIGKGIEIGRGRGKWRLIVRMRIIDIVVDIRPLERGTGSVRCRYVDLGFVYDAF